MTALMATRLYPLELDANIGNMMPVLHDVWLYIHTNVIIFSYALIFMASVTALLYLPDTKPPERWGMHWEQVNETVKLRAASYSTSVARVPYTGG